MSKTQWEVAKNLLQSADVAKLTQLIPDRGIRLIESYVGKVHALDTLGKRLFLDRLREKRGAFDFQTPAVLTGDGDRTSFPVFEFAWYYVLRLSRHVSGLRERRIGGNEWRIQGSDGITCRIVFRGGHGRLVVSAIQAPVEPD